MAALIEANGLTMRFGGIVAVRELDLAVDRANWSG